MSPCHIRTEVDYEPWDQLCWLIDHGLPPAAVWLHWHSCSGQSQSLDLGRNRTATADAASIAGAWNDGTLENCAIVLRLWLTP